MLVAGSPSARRRRRRRSRRGARSGRATPSAPATSSSFGDQPPSGPTATPCRRRRSGRPPGSAAATVGQHLDRRRRPGDLGQPHPPRLHRRLGGDAAQALELALGAVLRPAHDRALGVEQDDAVDADLGALGDEPLEAVALRRRHGDRQRRVADAAPSTTVARRLDAVAGELGARRQRPAPSVTVTASPSRRRSTRPRWCSASALERGRADVGDERRGRPARRSVSFTMRAATGTPT